MGHTLVTRFDSQSRRRLSAIMRGTNANKIPFGRDCDRGEANAVMDYHVTLLHWAKDRDEYYLERLRDFIPLPCQIRVTGTKIMRAEEGSRLLYFTVEPAQGFPEMIDSLERHTCTRGSRFFHITLAVSKDPGEIHSIEEQIRSNTVFPFTLDIDGLDLYHIWKPTRKVRSM